jgi:hypothetical protein
MAQTELKGVRVPLKPKTRSCKHDYENIGYVGKSVFYRCALCGDEYEKDVS